MQNACSRFGLCLVNTESTDQLFEKAQSYQPNYFPKEMSIDILPNTDQPKFPWIFRLPYRGGKKETAEPKNHSNQIQKLTKATFEMETLDANSGYVSQFNKTDNISFKENSNLRVVLDFDFNQQNKSYYFEDLDLLVKY